jgi:transglutaminase 1
MGLLCFVCILDDEKPNYGHGTLVAVPLLKRADRHLSWNVVLENAVENTITVQVTTASDAVVAKWHMEVDTKIINDGAYSYSWDTGIYILFNPWCKHDQVYMKAEEWRDETVLNDVGIIWRGTANRMRPVIWKYDQFEKDILECSLYLIRVVGRVKNAYRADPVRTTRALAAAVNSADDLGAVMGNWSEDHSGGLHQLNGWAARKSCKSTTRKRNQLNMDSVGFFLEFWPQVPYLFQSKIGPNKTN